MGEIKVFGKWDLEKGVWIQNPNSNIYGRSFAIANYDLIFNYGTKIDHIILASGSRVEDHTKDFPNVKDKKAGIKNIINHYRYSEGIYNIEHFLMDADAPIIEDAKLFAKYIEYLASLPSTNSINVIGLSKCSVMNFYVPSFFTNSTTFHKTNIYNVASPYDGTKIASPLVFYPEIRDVIKSKIGNENLSNYISSKLINLYENVNCNSHINYDIAIPGGVPKEKKNLYDETLIKNVFCSSNVDAIKALNSFKNFLTGIDSDTLKEAIRTMNFFGIGLCILNDLFFNKQSDGMVYIDSQRKVEDVLGIKSHQLVSAHHDVSSNVRVLNDILNVIDKTIIESNERNSRAKKLTM